MNIAGCRGSMRVIDRRIMAPSCNALANSSVSTCFVFRTIWSTKNLSPYIRRRYVRLAPHPSDFHGHNLNHTILNDSVTPVKCVNVRRQVVTMSVQRSSIIKPNESPCSEIADPIRSVLLLLLFSKRAREIRKHGAVPNRLEHVPPKPFDL